jgi:hypothetical protein
MCPAYSCGRHDHWPSCNPQPDSQAILRSQMSGKLNGFCQPPGFDRFAIASSPLSHSAARRCRLEVDNLHRGSPHDSPALTRKGEILPAQGFCHASRRLRRSVRVANRFDHAVCMMPSAMPA